MNSFLKGSEHQFLRKDRFSTESKCFQKKVVKCVIFNSFLGLNVEKSSTNRTKNLYLETCHSLGEFGGCSFSGMLETKEQITLDLKGNRKGT